LTARSRKHRLSLLAALCIFALALVPAAFAGKGGGAGKPSGGGTSVTFTGPVMSVDANADGVLNHGDSITFNVSTSATATPTVGLRCYQNGIWVYDSYLGYYAGGTWSNPWFTLDSGYWTSGAPASCTARLFYYDNRSREHVLATLNFPVGA
jgi:hypothetical protein